MKVLHTSDWHLGKKLYKKDRQEEHQYFLNWLSNQITTLKVNVLIIAGDIFDSPIPPTVSLRQYFNFLSEVTQSESLKQILIISGNHDSGNFLEAPTPFLAQNKIKIIGTLTSLNIKDYIYDYQLTPSNSVRFTLLPFFKTHDMIKKDDVINAETQVESLLLKNLQDWLLQSIKDHQGLKILVGHHLFGNFNYTGSEQTVTLSGLESLPISLFKKWDILALGHIHKKQIVSKDQPFALYSGSPIAMRFSESNNKGVSLFTIDENGNSFKYEELKVPLSREILRLIVNEKNFEEKISKVNSRFKNETKLSPYVEITLEIDRPNAHITQKIRKKAKDSELDIINFITLFKSLDTQEDQVNITDIYNMTPLELFNQYLSKNDVGSKSKEKLVTTFKQVQSIKNDQKNLEKGHLQ